MDTGVAIASKEQLHIWGQVLACLDLSRASGISSMSCCHMLTLSVCLNSEFGRPRNRFWLPSWVLTSIL